MLISDLNSALQVAIFFSLGFTLLEDIKLTNLNETDNLLLELQRALNTIESCEKRIEHNRLFDDHNHAIADSVKDIQSASKRIGNSYKLALMEYSKVKKAIEDKLSKPKSISRTLGLGSVLILFFGSLLGSLFNSYVQAIFYYIIITYAFGSIIYVLYSVIKVSSDIKRMAGGCDGLCNNILSDYQMMSPQIISVNIHFNDRTIAGYVLAEIDSTFDGLPDKK